MNDNPRAPLSREKILEAAIALVDAESASALSMRRLGRALDVEAMSLYRYVANRQDVLDGMVGMLISRMTDFTDLDGEWQDAVAHVCRAYRRVTQEHPNVFLLSAGRPLVSGEDHEGFRAVMRVLRAADFPRELAEDTFLACAALVRGFALSESDSNDTSVDGIDWNDQRAFERALASMLAGIEELRRSWVSSDSHADR